MAGAGYKLFNTGDVLTAAQVNTYLMEQTVMVFADAAARTTALTGVVSEGMISYLKDTNAVEVYNGSAWVASDDPNAIQNTIVDAKGDLITATAADTPARLAVGSNGDTLVADSASSVGLRYQANFAAGKNKIINGDFGIWQRGTSFTNPAVGDFTSDRWRFNNIVGTPTSWSVAQQTFTPGAAPVAGYESQYFIRSTITTVGTATVIDPFAQRIEDVRTLAGQTVTLSFWAKADSNRTVSIFMAQRFGSGGSAGVDFVDWTASFNLTTSWQRFSHTVAVPSISGKTLGAGNFLLIAFRQAVAAGSVLDLWGIQLEAGSVATAFQTATGTLQGEIAACQRYYWRATVSASGQRLGVCAIENTTTTDNLLQFPVTMRTNPTALEQSGTATDYSVRAVGVTTVANAVPTFLSASTTFGHYQLTVASGLTAGQAGSIRANSANAYLGWSAEL
jgi:hypothetical protein